MENHTTIPTLDKIEERIRACREELAALQKLHRMAKNAQTADEARNRRKPVGTFSADQSAPALLAALIDARQHGDHYREADIQCELNQLHGIELRFGNESEGSHD